MININEKYPFYKAKIILKIHPEPYARPRLGRNRIFYNPRDKYKKKIISLLKDFVEKNKFEIISGEIRLKLIFGIVAPKTMTNSKLKTKLIQDDILHPLTRPDIDNYIKPILDSLNKTIFVDDSQVYELTCKKKYVLEEKEEFIKILIMYRKEPIKLR